MVPTQTSTDERMATMKPSFASKHRKFIPLRLAPSNSSGSGWTPINRLRSPSAIRKSPGRQSVEKHQRSKRQKKASPRKSSHRRPITQPNTGSDAEPEVDLTSYERQQWEQQFDRVLQNIVAPEDDLPDFPTFPHDPSSEDDLPKLSDVPDLARTSSKTPLRSSPCPPTPRSRSMQVSRPSSKSRGQSGDMVILISDTEDEIDEDLMSVVDVPEHDMLPGERRVRALSSVSAYNSDAVDGADAQNPTSTLR